MGAAWVRVECRVVSGASWAVIPGDVRKRDYQLILAKGDAERRELASSRTEFWVASCRAGDRRWVASLDGSQPWLRNRHGLCLCKKDFLGMRTWLCTLHQARQGYYLADEGEVRAAEQAAVKAGGAAVLGKTVGGATEEDRLRIVVLPLSVPVTQFAVLSPDALRGLSMSDRESRELVEAVREIGDEMIRQLQTDTLRGHVILPGLTL